ncbi:FAD-dependent oxidoreductase [Mucilaginibacter sp. BJC16-A38]|uniref:flavin monoamine oxidase family protein n=1 Tax=Mucilaginibacter phenanthrenivorans TaxID=1234842 RepID=UPI002157C10A|nr:NAD(P)/FAD-dependent oxidoreductase [Mucilaginibacter phenanthrenivorans]MCR8560730.1 FAD-dependent oxidoreductase [Mucilaginibacter phenanthrenivorans]
MQSSHILIIGAGATGLIAAHILSKAGKKVTVLEARNRCGGRIHTLNYELFFKNAELGAEFVHGDLPVTLNLLREAGISYHSASGEMWHYKDGKFGQEGEFKDWDKVVSKLGELKADISIKDFLDKEFPGDEHKELRAAVIRFVSGYDTADPARASSFALREEWQNEDEGAQHRVEGGYGVMVKYLEDECKHAGAEIYLNSIVREIQWQPGKVKVVIDDGTKFEASQVLIALPLGVLQADKSETGAITFAPEIEEQNNAVRSMGFGSIIKVLLEFDEPFWEDKETEKLAGTSLKNMGFILSEEAIPTWWTQTPQHTPVLTGWLGGLPAFEKRDASPEEILQLSLQSISNIFKRSVDKLKAKLVAYDVANWTADPFTRGSYAYDTIEAATSRKLLNEPIDNTIFFSGEYLYEGPAMGTVEAALTSGIGVAEKMLN